MRNRRCVLFCTLWPRTGRGRGDPLCPGLICATPHHVQHRVRLLGGLVSPVCVGVATVLCLRRCTLAYVYFPFGDRAERHGAADSSTSLRQAGSGGWGQSSSRSREPLCRTCLPWLQEYGIVWVIRVVRLRLLCKCNARFTEPPCHCAVDVVCTHTASPLHPLQQRHSTAYPTKIEQSSTRSPEASKLSTASATVSPQQPLCRPLTVLP